MKNVYEMDNNGAKAYYSSAAKAAKEIHGILSRALTHHECPRIILLDSRGHTVSIMGSMTGLTKRFLADTLEGTGEFRARIASRTVICIALEVH